MICEKCGNDKALSKYPDGSCSKCWSPKKEGQRNRNPKNKQVLLICTMCRKNFYAGKKTTKCCSKACYRKSAAKAEKQKRKNSHG